eukprot:3456814-Amphidinium_carterae.3
MIESFILAGSQKLVPGETPLSSLRHPARRYGRSVTDACVDIGTTKDVFKATYANGCRSTSAETCKRAKHQLRDRPWPAPCARDVNERVRHDMQLIKSKVAIGSGQMCEAQQLLEFSAQRTEGGGELP